MNISKDELKEMITDSKNGNKVIGKRKFWYCSAAALLVFSMTFMITMKYGPDSKDIITWVYVALAAVLIGLYPTLNVIGKFAGKIAGEKIGKLLDSVGGLVARIKKTSRSEED